MDNEPKPEGWKITPLYSRLQWGGEPIELEPETFYAFDEETARARWYKKYPFGLYATILKTEPVYE